MILVSYQYSYGFPENRNILSPAGTRIVGNPDIVSRHSDELEIYLGLVQALPNDNLFAGTIQVYMIDDIKTDTQAADVASSPAVYVVASTAFVILILSSFGVLVYRKKTTKDCQTRRFQILPWHYWTRRIYHRMLYQCRLCRRNDDTEGNLK